MFSLNIVKSKECSFCKSYPETPTHIFCECHWSKHVWSQLQEWIRRRTGNKLKFENKNIFFGFKGSQNDALNCLMIIVKKVIYAYRCKKKLPRFSKCQTDIIDYYKKDKYIAESSCKGHIFDKKWYSLKNLFTDE